MKEYHDKLILGKGSAFVKSHLSRLPRTDEVWEADIQPISVWGWNAGRHGELWLGMVLTQTENFHLALLANEAAPGINDLAILLAKAMEHPWVMGKRRPARIVLRNNPQWEELIPHLTQLKIEVELQQELPLWDDAADEYVRKLKASWIGREVPIITVPQEFDEAFPALVRWVKTQGRIEIGVEGQQGFVVRALDDEWDGVRGQDRQVRWRGVDRPATEDRPGGLARQESDEVGCCTQRQPSQGRRGGAAGAVARSAHKVSVPISAAECRLILETAKLDDEIVERLDEIDPREEVVSLTIAELVRLAIATSGDPTRLSNETDRNMWVRLSDRFHEVVGGILRSDRP